MGPGRVQTRPPPAHKARTPNLLPSLLQSQIELELGRTKAPESPSMCRNQAADLGEGQGPWEARMGPGRAQTRPPPAPKARTANLLPSLLRSRIELELG